MDRQVTQFRDALLHLRKEDVDMLIDALMVKEEKDRTGKTYGWEGRVMATQDLRCVVQAAWTTAPVVSEFEVDV